MIEVLDGVHETVLYRYMKGVCIYHNVENVNYPIHWHTALEIIMPYRSPYTVEINNHMITFDVGDIFLIPPGTLHKLYSPKEGERLIALFDSSLISNLLGLETIIHLLNPYKFIKYEETPTLANELHSYLKEIEDEYFSRKPFNNLRIYSLFIQLFASLGRANIKANSEFSNISQNNLNKYIEDFLYVCNYINDHCTENITVDTLASLTGFSKYHFSRLFKQFIGMSWYNYLLTRRIMYAEKLLTKPNITITEVAMASGFNSLSTFNRVFKEFKHRTPSEYKSLSVDKNNHTK
ncbi:MAG: AraC family transcriptional regulator [Clostridiales bacterium]|nr:AraC family transcriptional regulator [Clostridiales bacterium]